MNKDSTVIDAFDYMLEEEEQQVFADRGQIDTVFIRSLNLSPYVDVEYIAGETGSSVQQVIDELGDAIFQQPELACDGDSYDITRGWTVSSSYFSGNLKDKLAIARAMNKKFPGRFKANITALKSKLPPDIDIDDIHIGLGASWIPCEEYALFARDFLELNDLPDITYNEELSRINVRASNETNASVLNTITYGVREEVSGQGEYARQYMTALDILEHTVNGRSIKIHDYIPTAGMFGSFRYEPVFNRDKTVEAQEKQQVMIDAFRNWVYKKKSRIERFEGYYNEHFVGYSVSHYDGSFLTLPGLNPDICLYKYQKDAIARILLSGTNTLLAHDVGAGKTYVMIVAAHELYRMGMSKKTLLVLPNNVLKATVDMHRLLYKDDNILVITPKDFTPAKRNEALKKIRDGSYVAVYMAYSSFDMVVMSKDYHIKKMQREITELKSAAYNSARSYEKKQLVAQAKQLSKKLSKFTAETFDSPWLTYDKLGVDTLIVDEAHNYKNIPIRTHVDNIVGMHTSGSKKCCEMLEKCRVSSRIIFATGTPLTNSMTDLFALQTYLQEGVLAYHNIKSFDRWCATFGTMETSVEVGPDANSNSLRVMTRYSTFHNLPELMSIFSQVCDFHYIPKNNGDLPAFDGYTDIVIPRNEAQIAIANELTERVEKIHNREVTRHEDNMLKVTIYGLLAGLDDRLADSKYPHPKDAKTKVDYCAENILRLYTENPGTAQVVFCDIGTPKKGFNIYDCLADTLVEVGIPRHEIAFVHDAKTESARTKLFADINSAKIRVCIGSTPKLGVGVNIQRSLIAEHHLSLVWRPSDMVQREGRIIRKGNEQDKVYIFRYITQGLYDAFGWQLLESKQKFIASFLRGTLTDRNADNIDEMVLDYADVKALAIGNDMIKKRVVAANRVERIKVNIRARQRQIQELRGVVDSSVIKIERLSKQIKNTRRDYRQYTIDKTAIPAEDRVAFGEELLDALRDNIGRRNARLFDSYQGFDVMLPADMTEEYPFVLLRSSHGNEYHCALDFEKTPLGCSRTVDYLLDHLDERADKLKEQLDTAKKQMNDALADLEEENPHIAKLEKAKRELDEIDEQIAAAREEKQVC